MIKHLYDDYYLLSGQAAKDAEVKEINSRHLTKVSIVVDKVEEEATFANIDAWNDIGRYCANIKKRDMVFCIGKKRTYTGRNGETYDSYDINNNCFVMFTPIGSGYSSKSSKSSNNHNNQDVPPSGELPW